MLANTARAPSAASETSTKAPERHGHGLAFKEEVLRDYVVTE